MHKSGCGIVKASGFVQYLNSNPWLVGIILLIAGAATCFYGGELIEGVYSGIPALFTFIFVSVMVSSFGVFEVFEEDNPTTGKGVVLAIIGFAISAAAAFGVGYIAN